MNYLLDTQIFLWWLAKDKKLKESIKKIIADPQNTIYVSVTNAWEISIKYKIGKLPLKTTLEKCFEVTKFPIININLQHILQLDKLPLIHKDPFDRLLIAQSMIENLTLITSDPKIWQYKIDLLKV